ncbi:MAG: dCTP deaminase [Thermoplasmata archaeon]|nr:dCTP deaminase [Thermoplasmata archaeon]MCK4455380.1 dCTP deaminase [Thermoplasmata archaeon]
MTILSDEDISEFMREGKLRITDFREENLTPNGYDLTIDEVFVSGVDRTVNEGRAEIPPQTWFAIGTKERVEMSKDIAAQLWIRTSWARKGVMASFGKIDAGFEGNLTLSAFNSTKEVIDVPIGETFAQVVFEKLDRPAKRKYDERSGHFQDQEGITLKKTR